MNYDNKMNIDKIKMLLMEAHWNKMLQNNLEKYTGNQLPTKIVLAASECTLLS